jgi:hypothetical protein
MTLEQRVEALEKAFASMAMPKTTTEEFSKLMQKVATDVIKNAQRPGGILHKSGVIEKAAIDSAASRATYHLKAGINVRS